MGVIFQFSKDRYEAGYVDGLPVWWKLNVQTTKKYMKYAKTVKETESPCYSRDIGVVIVEPDIPTIISAGHNGPPADCPPNDDADYLKNVVWPQLSDEEKRIALSKIPRGEDDCESYVKAYADCKTCPRKPINAPSGKRLDLCTCIHGEVDAITKAKASGGRLAGSYMICYCGVPCNECTKVIINSRLSAVMALDLSYGKGDYSPYSSRWMFKQSKVDLVLVPEEWAWKE